MTAQSNPAESAQLARLVAGTGGPVGVTVDGRAVALSALGTSAVGFPTFRWGLAPAGLATRRQLAACGLRRGSIEPVAQLGWRRGHRYADLYPVADARPKRPATPAQLAALANAMRARRTCPVCGVDAGYVLPRQWRSCLVCQAAREPCAA